MISIFAGSGERELEACKYQRIQNIKQVLVVALENICTRHNCRLTQGAPRILHGFSHQLYNSTSGSAELKFFKKKYNRTKDC